MCKIIEKIKNLTKEECLNLIPKDLKFNKEPFLHQLQAIFFALLKKNPAFFMEMGTGKTLTTINWLKMLNIKEKILIITVNKPLAENWLQEFKNECPELEGGLLFGSFEERKKNINIKSNFYIINFEGLKVIWEELYNRDWEAIIIDESRRIMNIKAIRTKLCLELAKKAKYRAILSGIPMINPLDIFTQYLFLDLGETFGKNFYKFRNNFFKEIKKGKFIDWKLKKEKEQEFYDKVNQNCFIVKKKDCLDLPEKIHRVLYVDLSPDQWNDYYALAKGDGNLTIANLNKKQIENCFIKYSQITGGFIKDSNDNYQYYLENEKINTLLNLIEDSIYNTKIIVFHRFIAEGRLIEQILNSKKIKYASMRSEIKNIEKEVYKFQNDDDIRVLIAHPLSGGIGLNFTNSNLTIYYSLDWNIEYKLQSEDRNHRIGQIKNVEYIHLLAKKTIDEEIWKAHQEGISLIERMTRYKLTISDIIFGKGISWKEPF